VRLISLIMIGISMVCLPIPPIALQTGFFLVFWAIMALNESISNRYVSGHTP